MRFKTIFIRTLTLPLLAVLLVSCGSSSSSGGGLAKSYQVSVTNMSYGQPLAPLAVVMHEDAYQAWQVGVTASMGLELLAEGGDNSIFLQEALDKEVLETASGDGVILPGGTGSVELELVSKRSLQLTLASMLVNTNDAYTGINGLDLSEMKVGDQLKQPLMVYDAGTEANSEMAGSIPGPADGGEGFNAMRDDLGRVAHHPGVATRVANHPESVLDQSHRFDSPVAMLRITRLK